MNSRHPPAGRAAKGSVGKQKPTVYLLHGLLGTAHQQFGPQVRAWKDELAVVPLDLPGHGRASVRARTPYIPYAVRYALAVMSRFGPGRVIAASYLGSPVAVRCALRRPDLVQSLVLTGFVPGVPRELFATWLDSFGVVAADNPELIRWYEKMHGPGWRNTLAAYTREVREHYHDHVCVTGDMLARLDAPILIANGSAKSNERAAALEAPCFGPAVSGHVIEGAGHIPGLDRPDEFAAAVQAFWNRNPVAAHVAVP